MWDLYDGVYWCRKGNSKSGAAFTPLVRLRKEFEAAAKNISVQFGKGGKFEVRKHHQSLVDELSGEIQTRQKDAEARAKKQLSQEVPPHCYA